MAGVPGPHKQLEAEAVYHMNHPDRHCSWEQCDLPMGSSKPDQANANAAALRVRARRRIAVALGVYQTPPELLAPLLRVVLRLEKTNA